MFVVAVDVAFSISAPKLLLSTLNKKTTNKLNTKRKLTT
jgi:hypothetical protein